MAVEVEGKLISGTVNGITCVIAPDTGAEVTLVQGHLVCETQLLDDWVSVKGASGTIVKLQKAVVLFEVEGRRFSKEVVVANGSTFG